MASSKRSMACCNWPNAWPAASAPLAIFASWPCSKPVGCHSNCPNSYPLEIAKRQFFPPVDDRRGVEFRDPQQDVVDARLLWAMKSVFEPSLQAHRQRLAQTSVDGHAAHLGRLLDLGGVQASVIVPEDIGALDGPQRRGARMTQRVEALLLLNGKI